MLKIKEQEKLNNKKQTDQIKKINKKTKKV